MPQPGIQPERSFMTVEEALDAMCRAAVELAKKPHDALVKDGYGEVRRGVVGMLKRQAADGDFKVRKDHYLWHRRALRRALEDPELQPTDARYLGYLSALRRIAKELNVPWPPYGPDDSVHSHLPVEALAPELPSAAPRRKR